MMIFGPEDDEDEILDTGVDDGEADEEQSDVDDADLDDAEQLDPEADGGNVDRSDDRVDASDQPVDRPVSRAQARIETAVREAKEARQAADRAERDLAAFRTQQDTGVAAERERQALENMDPYQRLEYRTEQQARENKAHLDRITFQMADSADRTDFASKAARMPALAAVADDVEAALAAMRNNGTTAPRETIAKYLLGERALQRGAAARTRGAKAGAARVDRATARPGGSRSDVRTDAPRGDTREARAKRLQDVPI